MECPSIAPKCTPSKPNFGVWSLDLAPEGKRFAVIPRPEATVEQKGSVHVTVMLSGIASRRSSPATIADRCMSVVSVSLGRISSSLWTIMPPVSIPSST